jgi:hypothetical protein
MNKIECCICGPVKNCGPFLDKVFENIEKIGALFKDYKIIIFYDKSNDNTLSKLKEYQSKNDKLKFYVNNKTISKFRTHNIAYARNYCLNYIKNTINIETNERKYPYFIMMDFDEVNCKNINVDILPKYFERDDWDALSFNTNPKYYDIWGLSINPYCFSYNHFDQNAYNNYYIIQNFIMKKLKDLPKNELLGCISSFNGFSIYRTDMFINCYYDGAVRFDLIPKEMIKKHANIARSNILFYDYGNVNGKYEDCEHRAFHAMAINKNNAKIRISSEILFR